MLESGDCISVIASLYLYETYDILRAKGDDIQLSMLGSKIIALEYEVALIDQIVDGASLSARARSIFCICLQTLSFKVSIVESSWPRGYNLVS